MTLPSRKSASRWGRGGFLAFVGRLSPRRPSWLKLSFGRGGEGWNRSGWGIPALSVSRAGGGCILHRCGQTAPPGWTEGLRPWSGRGDTPSGLLLTRPSTKKAYPRTGWVSLHSSKKMTVFRKALWVAPKPITTTSISCAHVWTVEHTKTWPAIHLWAKIWGMFSLLELSTWI